MLSGEAHYVTMVPAVNPSAMPIVHASITEMRQLVKDEEPFFQVVFLAEPGLTDGLLLDVSAAMSDVADKVRVERSSPDAIVVSPIDATKGSGLLEIARQLGVAPSQTMAVGDSDTDVSMLEAAAIGVAVGNAEEATKAAADFTVGTVYEGGVAEALRRFVLA